jgi:hypothetical protein
VARYVEKLRIDLEAICAQWFSSEALDLFTESVAALFCSTCQAICPGLNPGVIFIGATNP